MGLDKELFEGDVDGGFICGLCDQVLLNPVTAGCSHIVCQTCVNRSLKARVNLAVCPVCNAKLTRNTEDTTIDFKLNLLNLTLRCSHWCGSTFVLADLPDHMDICPCAPVDCKFREKGCRKSVRRCDISKHGDECDFRTVACEACGHTTIYRELFTHQSRVRCLEKKLKQQVIREQKAATQETNRHRERLYRDLVRLDQHQRKSVTDHLKSNNSRRKVKVSSDIDSKFALSPRDGIFLTEEVVQQHGKVVLQLKEEKEDTREMQRQRRRKDVCMFH